MLDRLTAGTGRRLTVVVGSAGAGKSVLLSSSATRPLGLTAWLSCDRADAYPVRFWAGFIGSIIGVGIVNLPTSLAFYSPITLISMALMTLGARALLLASLSRRHQRTRSQGGASI